MPQHHPAAPSHAGDAEEWTPATLRSPGLQPNGAQPRPFGDLWPPRRRGALLDLTTAGSAAADSTDDAFIHRVAADRILFATPTGVIERAHVVCEAFSTGASPATVHATMLNNSAMSPRQTALFMADAVQAYCPK